MKILGIDYGAKRVGIALVDVDVPIAVPRGVLANDAKLFRRLEELCRAEGVTQIVVGLPVTLRGEEGRMAKTVRRFVMRLEEETGLQVECIDERLTTKDLPREGMRLSDAVAAARILQLWIDRQKRENTVE